ncbi:MAG: Holliday junction resolvase RuvX [Burkholderiales bacterium]|jgi:putative Holliday junction resolvase|nr:Holliday junction resolvase RuvX [Burkholderiales bacterium]
MPEVTPVLAPEPNAPSTLLAFDFGRKRIGVAIGNTLTQTARPLTTLHAERREAREAALRALISEWQPQKLIVGFPVHVDGAEHEMTQHARRFARWLEEMFRLPVALVDERLTTQVAQSLLEESGQYGGHGGKAARAMRDAVAAQVILQAYFDEGENK